MGIARNIEINTMFGLAPILLRGTRMIALVHERLAVSLRAETSIRLLDPPMALDRIHQTLLWTESNAHRPRARLAAPTDARPRARARP